MEVETLYIVSYTSPYKANTLPLTPERLGDVDMSTVRTQEEVDEEFGDDCKWGGYYRLSITNVTQEVNRLISEAEKSPKKSCPVDDKFRRDVSNAVLATYTTRGKIVGGMFKLFTDKQKDTFKQRAEQKEQRERERIFLSYLVNLCLQLIGDQFSGSCSRGGGSSNETKFKVVACAVKWLGKEYVVQRIVPDNRLFKYYMSKTTNPDDSQHQQNILKLLEKICQQVNEQQ